jgi:flavodoxin II
LACFTAVLPVTPKWLVRKFEQNWVRIWSTFSILIQIGYPEWFQDAMGYLHSKVVARGAAPCGYWPIDGYEYEASKALTPDGTHFVGLALDEERRPLSAFQFGVNKSAKSSVCE